MAPELDQDECQEFWVLSTMVQGQDFKGQVLRNRICFKDKSFRLSELEHEGQCCSSKWATSLVPTYCPKVEYVLTDTPSKHVMISVMCSQSFVGD